MPPGRSALLTPKCRVGDKVARPPQPLERARVFLGTGYPAIKASYGPQLAQLWVQELRIRSPSDLVHRCSPPGAWREATEGNLSSMIIMIDPANEKRYNPGHEKT